MTTLVNFYSQDNPRLPQSYAPSPLRAAITALEQAVTGFGINPDKVVIIIDPSKTSVDISGTII